MTLEQTQKYIDKINAMCNCGLEEMSIPAKDYDEFKKSLLKNNLKLRVPSGKKILLSSPSLQICGVNIVRGG